MRQTRNYWDAILRSEGLGEIEFSSGIVSSSAATHKARTDLERSHFREPEALESVREILAEYHLPLEHRAMLFRHLRGEGVRQIAKDTGTSKDTVHRVLLRYTGNHDVATMAEISAIAKPVALDARRTRPARGTKPHRRPLTASETTAAYFELGAAFALTFDFKWARDREIWDLHTRGQSRRKVSRVLGMPDQTVRDSIIRTRAAFKAWLAQRKPDDENDQAQIRAMFETLTHHERY